MPFSLIENRWIPAIASNGAREWIAPRQIVEMDEQGQPRWVDLDWGRADLRLATYELLIGLFGTALALEDNADLPQKMRNPPSPEELDAALRKLAPYMQLDGEGPRFLQDRDPLADAELRPVQSLLMDTDGGGTHFVHANSGIALARKSAAVALYALQAFAPPGGRGHRTSIRGGGPLTTLILPPKPDLWRRIAINLPVLAKGDRRPPDDLSLVFPWARATRVSRDDVQTAMGPEHHTHWLQHYFGMPRRIRLDFRANADRTPCALTGEIDEMLVCGFRMEAYGVNYADDWRHPLTPYYEAKPNEWLPFHPQSGRIGYREWFGYLFDGAAGGKNAQPAEVVTSFLDAFGATAGDARLLAAGYVTDNMKTETYVETEIPLLTLPNTDARQALGRHIRNRLIATAEMVATELRRKISDALGSDFKKTIVANVMEQFWIGTEDAFRAACESMMKAYWAFEKDAAQDDVFSADMRPHIERWLADIRSVALRLFRQNAPLDQLGELSLTERRTIIDANKHLNLFLHGFGKGGQELFKKLELPSAEPKSAKKPSKAGETP